MSTKRSKTTWVAGSAPLENFGSHSERNNSTASTTSQSSCVIVTSESCDSDSEYPDVNVLPSFAHRSTDQSFIHEDSDFPAVNEQPNFAQEDSDFPDVDALPPMSNSCPDADYAPPDEQPPSNRPLLGRQSRSYENQDNQVTSHVFRSANQQEDSRRELRCSKPQCQMDSNEVGIPRLRRQLAHSTREVVTMRCCSCGQEEHYTIYY